MNNKDDSKNWNQKDKQDTRLSIFALNYSNSKVQAEVDFYFE